MFKRIALLAFIGLTIGLGLETRGWTAPKSVRKVVARRPYKHPGEKFTLEYPVGWKIAAAKTAVVIRSSDNAKRRGIFGVTRRPKKDSNEAAVRRELGAKHRPADLTQTRSRVAGLPAIKVVGSSLEDPAVQVVEYYVRDLKGRQYYILLRAPRKDWKKYAVSFDAMLNTLSFR